MRKYLTLSFGDYRNIARDPTLILLLLAPILIILVVGLGIPKLQSLLVESMHFDLSPYYDFVVSFFGLLPAMLCGFMMGFLILDERDEDIINYFSITPLNRDGYIAYRIGSSVIISAVFSYITMIAVNLYPVNPWKLIPIALMVGLEAPIFALILACFAQNKVEGLAIGKIAGMIILGSPLAYFIASPLKYLGGIFPTFWITQTFIEMNKTTTGYWVSVFTGIVLHCFIIYKFLKIFRERIN